MTGWEAEGRQRHAYPRETVEGWHFGHVAQQPVQTCTNEWMMVLRVKRNESQRGDIGMTSEWNAESNQVRRLFPVTDKGGCCLTGGVEHLNV